MPCTIAMISGTITNENPSAFVLEQEGNIQNQKRSHNKKKILARSIIQFDIRNLFYCLFKTCLFLITLRKTLIYDILSFPGQAGE